MQWKKTTTLHKLLPDMKSRENNVFLNISLKCKSLALLLWRCFNEMNQIVFDVQRQRDT